MGRGTWEHVTTALIRENLPLSSKQSHPFRSVFPVCTHYSRTKSRRKVIALFFYTLVEKLITTTKENDSLVAAL